MSDTGILDPRSSSLHERRALLHWAGVQRAFALRPQAARERLLGDPDPQRLLRAEGAEPAPEAWLESLARIGVVGVPFGALAYPERIARLTDAPPLLWVRGAPEVLGAPCVAIVGSRAATVYGRRVARALARSLAAPGVAVVSGLARGIDAEAHEGALDAAGPTVGMLASGPDRIYPPEHRDLARRVAESGAVETEFPPGTPPRGAYFPLRNRLISALARALVVVEARERSGSLVTARHAADQGVDVLAVPGPIDAPTSRGTNRLLRDGARPLLELRDALEAARIQLEPAPRGEPAEVERDPARAALLAALADGARTPDELGRAAGLAPQALATPLLELRLAGRIEEDRDGRLRLAGPLGGPRGAGGPGRL